MEQEWVRVMDSDLVLPTYWCEHDSDLVIQQTGKGKYELWTFMPEGGNDGYTSSSTNYYYRTIAGPFRTLKAAKAAYMIMYPDYVDEDGWGYTG